MGCFDYVLFSEIQSVNVIEVIFFMKNLARFSLCVKNNGFAPPLIKKNMKFLF